MKGPIRQIVLLGTVLVVMISAVALIIKYSGNLDELIQKPPVSEPAPAEDPIIQPPVPPVKLPPEPQAEPVPEPEPILLARFETLFEQNNDLVGWIQVPGTKIDYPVVYCEDNDFYLKHNFDRQPDEDGIPFLDMSADLLANNRSLALFGHHRTSGTMFSDLHKYKQLSHYKNYPLFAFDSLYEEADYKIFSVFYMAGNQTDGQFYYYPNAYFEDDAAFEKHVNELLFRSVFLTGVDVLPTDQLVLLTCCTYETDNLRLVIAGRKVRTGEDLEVNTENARLNPAPLYPQKWYDAKGGKPPVRANVQE